MAGEEICWRWATYEYSGDKQGRNDPCCRSDDNQRNQPVVAMFVETNRAQMPGCLPGVGAFRIWPGVDLGVEALTPMCPCEQVGTVPGDGHESFTVLSLQLHPSRVCPFSQQVTVFFLNSSCLAVSR